MLLFLRQRKLPFTSLDPSSPSISHKNLRWQLYCHLTQRSRLFTSPQISIIHHVDRSGIKYDIIIVIQPWPCVGGWDGGHVRSALFCHKLQVSECVSEWSSCSTSPTPITLPSREPLRDTWHAGLYLTLVHSIIIHDDPCIPQWFW